MVRLLMIKAVFIVSNCALRFSFNDPVQIGSCLRHELFINENATNAIEFGVGVVFVNKCSRKAKFYQFTESKVGCFQSARVILPYLAKNETWSFATSPQFRFLLSRSIRLFVFYAFLLSPA